MFFRVEAFYPNLGWCGFIQYGEEVLNELEKFIAPRIKVKCKFYYTLRGYKNIGYSSVAQARKYRYKYRLLKLYHVDKSLILYKDRNQIALRQ